MKEKMRMKHMQTSEGHRKNPHPNPRIPHRHHNDVARPQLARFPVRRRRRRLRRRRCHGVSIWVDATDAVPENAGRHGEVGSGGRHLYPVDGGRMTGSTTTTTSFVRLLVHRHVFLHVLSVYTIVVVVERRNFGDCLIDLRFMESQGI